LSRSAFRRRSLRILALDTTTRAGSVAIAEIAAGGSPRTLSLIAGDPAITHGERLPLELQHALSSTGLSIRDIDLLAVIAGPGSFTGLRVGIATIQGLAFATDLRVVPVSALEALALTALDAPRGDALIAPWMDAQRGEVFASVYAADGVTEIAPPWAAPPEPALAALARATGGRTVLFTGDGALRYRETIAAGLGTLATFVDPVPPLAPVAASIAAGQPERAVLPHAIVPIYVRRPDAELARARRRAESG
jgi:tRNA threonylcarbamoyladenosine biosynthesis protein TsaB